MKKIKSLNEDTNDKFLQGKMIKKIKYNKAKTPFSYFRNISVYMFILISIFTLAAFVYFLLRKKKQNIKN